MNVTEFTALSVEAQVGYMLRQGICIADRATKLYPVFLYQVAAFYVEVYHDCLTSEVLALKSLTSTDHLISIWKKWTSQDWCK